MKYLKNTFLIFIVVLILSIFSVNAISYSLIDITIPNMKKTYTSTEKTKTSELTEQTLIKVDATDDFSGDGRSILGRAMGTLSGTYTTTDWLSLPKGEEVSLGAKSKTIQGYKILLCSEKYFYTTASFYGVWKVD